MLCVVVRLLSLFCWLFRDVPLLDLCVVIWCCAEWCCLALFMLCVFGAVVVRCCCRCVCVCCI